MWPFSSRGSQGGTIAPHPQGLPNFKDFEKADAALKVWLPQVLSDRVNWLSKTRDVSRPDVVRALLFEHLYGRVAYEAFVKYATQERVEVELKMARARLLASSGSDDLTRGFHSGDIKQSASRYTQIDLQHLGKSVDDIDLSLPWQLKFDLEAVAQMHRLSASGYVRKMLVLQLLGERVHRTWQDAVGAISKEVLAIEKG
jgi:hypothetical protein